MLVAALFDGPLDRPLDNALLDGKLGAALAPLLDERFETAFAPPFDEKLGDAWATCHNQDATAFVDVLGTDAKFGDV